MFNLKEIIVVAAWLSIPVSIWAIVYFVGRIITRWHIRRHLGDMPSWEEIQEHYEQINQQYKGRSMLDQRTYYEKLKQEKDSPTE